MALRSLANRQRRLEGSGDNQAFRCRPMYVCIYTYVHTHTHTHTLVLEVVQFFLCQPIYVCMYIYICTHTNSGDHPAF